jgi:general secretion pathway protein D
MTILAPTTSPTSAPSTMPSTLTSKFTMNFKDMPIDPVLGFISQHTGVQILKDEPIDVRVTIMSKQPVSADEALSLLAAALKGNGFAVVRSGQVLHITSRDKARKGNVPVHFGNDPADIADTDELITQVVSVDNVSAAKLLTDLKPLIAEADIVANEGSNSIIVTDTSAAVKRLVTIIALLDKHEASTSVVRVRVLKHSSAPAVAKLIDTLFKGSPGAPVPQDPRQMQQQGQQGPPPGPSSERHGVTVVTAADERTNTLLVMASNSTQKMIDDVLDRLDADNPNPAPATELRSYILRFAQADATARLINNVLKAPASNNGFSYMFYGFGDNSEDKKPAVNAVADDRSNTVVVSAPTERFKEIEALIQKLDASPMASSSELRVIHLKYAAADDVASIVTEMFNPKKTDDSSPPFRYFFMGSDPNAGQSKPVPVNVTSDMRTNTLLVSAPAPVLDSIEKVVKQLDSDPATEDTMFIYHLRNGQASHMEYTLNVLFGNIGQQGQNNQQNGNGQNGQQPGGPGINFNQQQNNRQPVLGNSSPGNSQANSANRQRNQNNLHNESNLNPAKANNDLAGEVLVVADADTNSLLVTTASKYESQVKAIIAELDRPVPQVLIKCLVAEVTHDDSLNYGADFSVIDIHANGNGGSVANTVGAAAAALSTPSGVVAKIIDNDLQVTLQALAQANKLDVLSRPYILTSDNQDANITVGNEVPFVTDTFTDSTGGIHNNFQYQDIGIILDVTPHINPDGLVVMDVDPQISSLTGQNVTVQQGVNAPIYELRSAASRVAIRDGQTIVIGGLMQDQKTDHVNKIPLLGDIPLLGQLFQYHSNDKSKTELLIFLTPHVVPIPDELQQSTRDETRGTTLTPKAVAPGVFEEHMRGMQRGEVPQTQPSGASASPIKSIDMGAAATQP